MSPPGLPISFSQDFQVLATSSGLYVALGSISSVAAAINICFWYDLNPDGDNAAEIKVRAGEAHHGTRGVLDVAAKKFTLTIDHQYVWAQYVFGSGAVTLEGPSAIRPQNDSTTYRAWLHQFRLITGVASHENAGHVGYIDIPGAYA